MAAAIGPGVAVLFRRSAAMADHGGGVPQYRGVLRTPRMRAAPGTALGSISGPVVTSPRTGS
ncbi:MAG: hypothetical protein JWR58_6670 [Pseudonocardia sp.]|nr:hypothetical protein [Pseudonocardia sp.]